MTARENSIAVFQPNGNVRLDMYVVWERGGMVDTGKAMRIRRLVQISGTILNR